MHSFCNGTPSGPSILPLPWLFISLFATTSSSSCLGRSYGALVAHMHCKPKVFNSIPVISKCSWERHSGKLPIRVDCTELEGPMIGLSKRQHPLCQCLPCALLHLCSVWGKLTKVAWDEIHLWHLTVVCSVWFTRLQVVAGGKAMWTRRKAGSSNSVPGNRWGRTRQLGW